ncbi:Maf family protein [Aquicella lusitana]|uniref:Nucleoside triphosphate pyrophosphatase n=1 Tax=Aquicella lusitana TaxID=254246 RepID=A0A370FYQ8_9COXI|nr:Maf family protein [Aquicella lusitana]RDI36672.1 septum formation protein [Aquicella lusitana]VVC74052.1 Maf-like protein YceF [Aquicella lusitana]
MQNKSSSPLLVLSSSSPARHALLARLQIPFSIASPDVDETPLPGEPVIAMVERLAEAKAKKSAQQFPDALIIGCDQVGTLDDHVLTKPLSYENAVRQLSLISGRRVRFFTGICLFNAKTLQLQRSVEHYDVFFRRLSEGMIENYLQKEKPLHCAGSFQIEGLGISLISRLQGDDYTTLIGLPLIRLTDMLNKAGWPVP